MKKVKQLGEYFNSGIDNTISIAYIGVVSGFILILINALCV